MVKMTSQLWTSIMPKTLSQICLEKIDSFLHKYPWSKLLLLNSLWYLCAWEQQSQSVLLPQPIAFLLHETTPKIDDELALVVNSECSSFLFPTFAEVLSEKYFISRVNSNITWTLREQLQILDHTFHLLTPFFLGWVKQFLKLSTSIPTNISSWSTDRAERIWWKEELDDSVLGTNTPSQWLASFRANSI